MPVLNIHLQPTISIEGVISENILKSNIDNLILILHASKIRTSSSSLLEISSVNQISVITMKFVSVSEKAAQKIQFYLIDEIPIKKLYNQQFIP